MTGEQKGVKKQIPKSLSETSGFLDKTKHETLLCYSFTTTSFFVKCDSRETDRKFYNTNIVREFTFCKPKSLKNKVSNDRYPFSHGLVLHFQKSLFIRL
jgi:hypothetical protein